MSKDSRNVRTVREAMRLVSAYQFDDVVSLIHEDVVVDIPFQAFHQGPMLRGRDGFIAGLRFIPTVFRRFELTIHEIYDCPDTNSVIFEQTSEGVFAAGGGRYANHYAMIFGFRDEKIVLWREHFNPQIMNKGMAFMLDLGPGAD